MRDTIPAQPNASIGVFRRFLRGLLEPPLGLVYPERCRICISGRSTAAEGYICEPCAGSVRLIEPPFCERCGLPVRGAITEAFVCGNCVGVELHFERARAAALYRDLAKDVVHRVKYQAALWHVPFLGRLLWENARRDFIHERLDLVVPVPLHRRRHREREFNQSEEIARDVAVRAGLPGDEHSLVRIRETATQTALDRTQRADNMRNAFAVPTPDRVAGKNILLIDDVFTTGATTNACARSLKRAGAGRVYVWTVARGS